MTFPQPPMEYKMEYTIMHKSLHYWTVEMEYYRMCSRMPVYNVE